MINKPYHLEIWDYLNELFQIDWEIYDHHSNKWTEEYIYGNLSLLDCNLILGFYAYYDGKIELSYCGSSLEDSNHEDIEWFYNGKDMHFITMPTFETFEQFKEFIQYNYERFKPYLK